MSRACRRSAGDFERAPAGNSAQGVGEDPSHDSDARTAALSGHPAGSVFVVTELAGSRRPYNPQGLLRSAQVTSQSSRPSSPSPRNGERTGANRRPSRPPAAAGLRIDRNPDRRERARCATLSPLLRKIQDAGALARPCPRIRGEWGRCPLSPARGMTPPPSIRPCGPAMPAPRRRPQGGWSPPSSSPLPPSPRCSARTREAGRSLLRGSRKKGEPPWQSSPKHSARPTPRPRRS